MAIYVNEIKSKLEKEVTKGKTKREKRQMIVDILERYSQELEEEIKYTDLNITIYNDSSNYIGEITYGDYELLYEEKTNTICLNITHPNYESIRKEYFYREEGFLYSPQVNESLDSEIVSQDCYNFIIQKLGTP